MNKRWLKETLKAFENCGYTFGDTVKSVGQRFGISQKQILKLDSNENFFIPKENLQKILFEVVREIDPRIYPQEEEQELRERISAYVKSPRECIALGNGSDEIMERITRTFLREGDQAITVQPTFSMYKHAVKLQRAELIEVPLREDFSLDTEAILSKTTRRTKILFLCSPNNPTGNQFALEDIKNLLENFPGIIVIDEAYAEFARSSVASLCEDFDNLIVLRTFSKAFGLAGLRLGYCISNERVTTILARNVGLPYPVNLIALKSGVKILENMELVEDAIQRLIKERTRLIEELNKVTGVKAFDSKANFVMFTTEKSMEKVYQALLRRGIIVKKLGEILKLKNCFRTTVGLPEMGDRLIDVLKAINAG
ncbi:MAG: histidinol-phosphate transaminase [Candidatus Bathyarchaeota archaeon]|nr:histidinol-phosphate transaminase [Candidatus Bathyarchaeota archaeon]MCX8176733.1 histidinol-phosphate transaminase [Candidatus Bathyarchaeota archaeon]MDW8193262.1 histidinol-phosphate transaminase [Nitrososphaerota archaeon]